MACEVGSSCETHLMFHVHDTQLPRPVAVSGSRCLHHSFVSLACTSPITSFFLSHARRLSRPSFYHVHVACHVPSFYHMHVAYHVLSIHIHVAYHVLSITGTSAYHVLLSITCTSPITSFLLSHARRLSRPSFYHMHVTIATTVLLSLLWLYAYPHHVLFSSSSSSSSSSLLLLLSFLLLLLLLLSLCSSVSPLTLSSPLFSQSRCLSLSLSLSLSQTIASTCSLHTSDSFPSSKSHSHVSAWSHPQWLEAGSDSGSWRDVSGGLIIPLLPIAETPLPTHGPRWATIGVEGRGLQPQSGSLRPCSSERAITVWRVFDSAGCRPSLLGARAIGRFPRH